MPPPATDINGIIQYYEVEVTELQSGRFFAFVAVDIQINIGSLLPYHIYECRIAAYTVSVGPFTDTFQVTSGEAGEFLLVYYIPAKHIALTTCVCHH